ncbi:MAG: FeoB-associated Cys-rich membrane protein [Bacteroidales bacterium]
MTTKDLLLYVIIFAAVGFSLYRRYMKKKEQQGGGGKSTGTVPGPFSKDDDYEPYEKK